jgi:hypothetical protein
LEKYGESEGKANFACDLFSFPDVLPMLFELCSKLKMTLAEMIEKTRIDKVVGHKKEQMTIPSIFHCHSSIMRNL